MKSNKLEIELIPKTCSFSNVRTILPSKWWNILRKKSYEKAEYKCEICGESGKDQGYKHDVECHEIWEYDDRLKIQKLLGLVSLCPKCHQVKHFGRTSAVGLQAEAFKRLEIVNGWDHRDCVNHLAESIEVCADRSIYKWHIDLSVLYEDFEVPKDLIVEAQSKERVNKNPYKKKKKKKKK